ncbi:MAG: MBL fold metallo-hydrolase [Paracoccaceae bacterium]|nr:MBL fold metallo-hydrolase [Paracoccaceae bacterium]
MKLTVLGSGSPEPYARRASSGYLLEVAGTRILLDCGGGVYSRLLEAGYMPEDVDYLFFTHLHSDHMMDYGRLIHGAWEMAGNSPRVFGPAPLAHINERLFGADGALAHDLRARTEFEPSKEVWRARGGVLPRPWPAPEVTEIAPGFVYEADGWRLTACEVPHAQPHLICMAFRVDAGGKSFVYAGDAGHCEALSTLAQNVDLLLHWCYRGEGETVTPMLDRLSPTPLETARFAKEACVKRLLLTHFRVHMDSDEGHARAKAALAEGFGPNAGIVEDLDVYDI